MTTYKYNLRSASKTEPVQLPATPTTIVIPTPTVTPTTIVIPTPTVTPTTTDHVSNIMADLSSLSPAIFHGKTNEDIRDFLSNFDLWAKYRKLDNDAQRAALPLLLKEGAATWYSTQVPADVDTCTKLKAALKDRYDLRAANRWRRAADLWQMRQATTQSLDDFITDVLRAGIKIDASEEQILHVTLNGLRPAIRHLVIQHDLKSIEDLRKWGRLTESSQEALPTEQDLSSVMRELTALREDFSQMRLQSLQSHHKHRTPASSPSPRRVSFAPSHQRFQRSPSTGRPFQREGRTTARPAGFFRSGTGQNPKCGRCARQHFPSATCGATNKICYSCGKLGHIRIACRSVRQTQFQTQNRH